MLKRIRLLTLVTLTFMAITAHAAAMLDFLDNDYNSDLSNDQMQKLIKQAGAQRGWKIDTINETMLLATIIVRNKHTVAVNIELEGDNYDVTYNSSENMRYNENKKTIHRKYNGWVRNLVRDIDMAIQNYEILQAS